MSRFTKHKKGRKRNGIKKCFRRIVLLLNIAFAVALGMSYLARFISPANCSIIAFFGLSYPIFLTINFLLLIYWLVLWSRKILISAVVILLGFNYLGNFFTINFKQEESNQKTVITVLSYNVRVFNRWNWVKNENQGAKIIDFIRNMRSNIVCLQEFYSDKKNDDKVAAIMADSVLLNSHVSFSKKNNITFNSGIATFSNYPIVNRGRVGENNNDNFCIYTDLKIKNKIVRVYNIHLESIHLAYEDYDFIKKLNKPDTIDVEGAKSIFQKMKRSYSVRAKQAELISTNIEKCQYPIVLCGDFNDVPMSYTYRTVLGNLDDAFRESGNGTGSTYTSTYLPFRIDFILHSKGIKAVNYSTKKLSLSDHYPISCALRFEDE